MPHKLITRDTWYDYFDIDLLLKKMSHEESDYFVSDPITIDTLQSVQIINHAIDLLKSGITHAVVIAINLGKSTTQGWNGTHWTGLVLRHDITNDKIYAFYADSCAIPL